MVVIAYDPDSTIHGALYGCIHACYLITRFKSLKGHSQIELTKIYKTNVDTSVQVVWFS